MTRGLLFPLLLLSLAAGTPAMAGEEPCAALLDSRCQSCHYKSRICQKLGRKNVRGWQRTIRNMIRHGARLSAAEGKTLAECLAAAPAGAEFVCKN
ncbi:hypothetical protein ACUUL3_14305 [Thiovibrio sp. JS02]